VQFSRGGEGYAAKSHKPDFARVASENEELTFGDAAMFVKKDVPSLVLRRRNEEVLGARAHSRPLPSREDFAAEL